MKYLDNIRKNIEQPQKVAVLTEAMMWHKHGPLLWKADRFDGTPNFYPVYRWQDFYSYSLLALIVKKENLNLDKEIARKAGKHKFESLSPRECIDRDIERLSGPIELDLNIDDPQEYLEKVAEAMSKDVGQVEALNPGYTNIVMCGGKDSMNLLLLPWKNPVIALSAEPNYPLVCAFVKINDLAIDVLRLEDTHDAEILEEEKLECCCRMALGHWKWAVDLRQLANNYDQKVIFWKGQSGEVRLTDIWKRLVWPQTLLNEFLGRVYKQTSFLMPDFLNYYIGEKINPMARHRNWLYTSSKLGSHMGFIRAMTSSLALSPFCGPNMIELFKHVNLARVLQIDRRPEYGKVLLGREVWYPAGNPGPPLSKFRAGGHAPEQFIELLKKNGIAVK